MRISNAFARISRALLAIGLGVAFTGLLRGQENSWLPNKEVRWRVTVADSPRYQRLIEQILEDADRKQLPIIPKFNALAIADIVLMRTPGRMFAVDFVTGKRIWTYPWVTAQTGEKVPEYDISIHSDHLQQRIWEQTPYGQFSTDGKSIFFLDDVGFVSLDQLRLVTPRRLRLRPEVEAANSNSLLALSIAREGAMVWRVGGAKGGDKSDEPKLAGAYFLGAPLAVDGSLYVMAELDGKIQLLVLNAETGSLDWSVELKDVAEDDESVVNIRRLAGARPVVQHGTVICPTTPNAVIGVDVQQRDVRWTYKYETAPAVLGRVDMLMRRLVRDVRRRWSDAQAVACGDHVLVSTYESAKLHCLSLDSGELEWATQRGESLFFEYLDDTTILLVGTRLVEAINVADGTPKWVAPTLLVALPSGRGFHENGFYYLPTADANVLRIDVTTGEIEGQAESQHPLGNLLRYKENVISHGPLWLSAFERH